MRRGILYTSVLGSGVLSLVTPYFIDNVPLWLHLFPAAGAVNDIFLTQALNECGYTFHHFLPTEPLMAGLVGGVAALVITKPLNALEYGLMASLAYYGAAEISREYLNSMARENQIDY